MSITVQIDVSRLDERTESLWRDGYLGEAVRREAELLLIRIADLAGLPDLYGQPLIARVLNERTPALSIAPGSKKRNRNDEARPLGCPCAGCAVHGKIPAASAGMTDLGARVTPQASRRAFRFGPGMIAAATAVRVAADAASSPAPMPETVASDRPSCR